MIKQKIYGILMVDDSVSIIRCFDGVDPNDEIKKWDKEDQEKVKSISPLKESDIPKSREFRNAWTLDQEKIKHDMVKAAEIQMDKIRKKRNEKLKELDIETLKGIDVQTEKQILRDITKNFDLSKAKTPTQLKKLWPKELE